MSEFSEVQSGPKLGRHEDRGALSTPSMRPPSGEADKLDLQGRLPAGPSRSTEVNPSPSEESGLLSLPWEMIVNIASYLPAQCVYDVLPKVCQALACVASDVTAWRLRARRMTGSRSVLVEPKEDSDWPAACIEMEQLISDWAIDAHRAHGQIPCDGEEKKPDVPRQQAERGGEPAAERQRDGLENESEDVGVALEYMSFPTSHSAGVNSILLLGGEGRVCATASKDWNVKLWDLEARGAELHTLRGKRGLPPGACTHQGWAWCLASRGPLLASGGFDRTVRLWDLQAGGRERGRIKSNGVAYCLSFQRDVLLAGSLDSRVTMYDPRADNSLIKSLDLHGSPVLSLAADDKYIVSGGMDHIVTAYDRRADKTLNKIRLSSDLMSMSSSGGEVWAGDSSGTLQCFSMQSGRLERVSVFDVGHSKLITGIHKTPGSLYTCSADGTVKIHIPCAPPKTLCTLLHQDRFNTLSVQAGVLAVASGSRNLEVWRSRG